MDIPFQGPKCIFWLDDKNILKVINVEEVGKINKWLHTSHLKWKGIALMQRILPHCTEDSLSKHGKSWIELSCQAAVKDCEDESIHYLAAYNFTKLLSLASSFPALARSISATIITHLEEILSSTLQDPIPPMICLDAVLHHFPGPCGPFKGKVSKHLFHNLVSSQCNVRSYAIRCWSKIPVLGGGGSEQKLHIAQWEAQFLDTVAALEYVVHHLYEPNHAEDVADPSLKSICLYFPALPTKEPDLSFTLLTRFISLSECIIELLSIDFNLPVTIPADRLFNFLVSCFDISPKSLGWTAEMQHRSEYVINVHASCLKLLQKLIANCPHWFSSHLRASTMNRIFVVLLTSWRDRNARPGSDKRYSQLRIQVYDTLICWIQSCGAASRFLCGQENMVASLMRSLTEDIIPTTQKMLPSANDAADDRTIGVTSSKRRRRNVSEMTFSQSFDHRANMRLCAKALKVLRVGIFTMASRVNAKVHTSLRDATTPLLSTLLTGGQLVPYTKSDECRKELYHLYLALVMAPSATSSIPLRSAMSFFCRAASHDSSAKVRSFCREASVTVSNLFHPRAPNLNSRPGSAHQEAKSTANGDSCSYFNGVSAQIPDEGMSVSVTTEPSAVEEDRDQTPPPAELVANEDSMVVSEDDPDANVADDTREEHDVINSSLPTHTIVDKIKEADRNLLSEDVLNMRQDISASGLTESQDEKMLMSSATTIDNGLSFTQTDAGVGTSSGDDEVASVHNYPSSMRLFPHCTNDKNVGFGSYTAPFLEREISGPLLLELKEFDLHNFFGNNKKLKRDFWSTLEKLRKSCKVKSHSPQAKSVSAMSSYNNYNRGMRNYPMPPPSHNTPPIRGRGSYNPPAFPDHLPPVGQMSHQTPYYESDDSFDDASDEERPWSPLSRHQGLKPMPSPMPPMGYHNRPPPIHKREEEDDTYLPLDDDVGSAPGSGGRNMLPPRHAERAPFPTPFQTPTARVTAPPRRPPKDSPGEVYEPVNDSSSHSPWDTGMPMRPAPAPPGPSPTRSPNSSFITRKGSGEKTRDSGVFGMNSPRSSNKSGNHTGHFPRRDGSQGSSSSGEHTDNETPSTPKRISAFPAMQPGHHGSNFRTPPQVPIKPMPPMVPVPTPRPSDDKNSVKATMAALSSKFASLTSPSRQTKPSEEVTSPSSKPISGFNAVPARDEFFRDRPAPRVPPTSGPQSVNPLLSPVSRQQPLEERNWFCKLPRASAQERIASSSCLNEGCFLVRPGRSKNTPYSLTVWANGKFFNLQIRLRSDNQYALGFEKGNERTFPSVVNMIEYYQKDSLQLAEGEGFVLLTGPP